MILEYIVYTLMLVPNYINKSNLIIDNISTLKACEDQGKRIVLEAPGVYKYDRYLCTSSTKAYLYLGSENSRIKANTPFRKD
jgi:hypothetical protein